MKKELVKWFSTPGIFKPTFVPLYINIPLIFDKIACNPIIPLIFVNSQ